MFSLCSRNSNGEKIRDIFYNLTENEIKNKRIEREQLRFENFEDVRIMEAKSGPLAGTNLMNPGIIQLIVPFLPLTRDHVNKCIMRELKLNGFGNPLINPGEEFIRKISNKQTYWKNLYSETGCRNIKDIVEMNINSNKIKI